MRYYLKYEKTYFAGHDHGHVKWNFDYTYARVFKSLKTIRKYQAIYGGVIFDVNAGLYVTYTKVI